MFVVFSVVVVPSVVWCAPQEAPAETTEEPAPAPQEAPAETTEEPAPVPQEVQVPKTFYHKLTVIVQGKAQSNGVIEMEFQLAGSDDLRLVKVNVLAKNKPKDIARDIWKELSLAAGNQYKVKHDGNKVNIKRPDKKIALFSLVIIGQSVTGMSVSTKR